jgi:CDP-diacylglycerol---glycerol-3-phosphate 3-phosphatidyltransferase
MLNGLRPTVTRAFTPLSRALVRMHVTPDMVTVVGTLGVSVSALVFFPMGQLFLGSVICTVFVLTDMLDGVLARVRGSSGPWGAFLDSTLDRVGDAAIFSGLMAWYALGGHDRLMVVVALYCLIVGALVSYVKARAEGVGLMVRVEGLVERPERILLTLVGSGLSGLGVPYVLPIGLWLVAVGSTVTFWQRMRSVHQAATADAGGDDGVQEVKVRASSRNS